MAMISPAALDVRDPGNSRSGPGSLPTIPIIFTASIVFLAVDATINLIRQRTRGVPFISTAVEPASDLSLPERQSLTQFVDKTSTILADIQAIERQLAGEKAQCTYLASERKRPTGRRPPPGSIDTKDLHRRRASNTTSASASSNAPTEPSCAFSAFCDRLLLTNHIWQQEKELKALHASRASTNKDRASTAFNTFCTQLLLHNRVWQLEREARILVVEKERVERARAAAVTRAAKRMVHEVQKDRMVEEFVKDLIEEVGDAKRAMEQARKAHESEVEEIHGEWRRDYRQVTAEVERLKLARRGGWAEQEVANAMEESLVERLEEAKTRIELLEKKIADYELEDEVTGGMFGEKQCDHDDEATVVELDTISELSSSSTCVSSGGSVQRLPKLSIGGNPPRRRCVSHGPLTPTRGSIHSRSSSTSSIVDTEAIFALKPLMVDQDKSMTMFSANIGAATRTCNHSGRRLAVRNRATSVLSLRSPTLSTTHAGSKAAGVAKRAPWRL
ncbi:hypothetical protein DXG03_009282 [Asterophora parasitica]|uniref:Uncharacterized protein n=1 Tax=Asterophora parasitica TaxID=117018 RepID=A0A9P7GBH2_9AGAR|nr:hypothetical protein DXG03_009282 [Asterophora parasitica]